MRLLYLQTPASLQSPLPPRPFHPPALRACTPRSLTQDDVPSRRRRAASGHGGSVFKSNSDGKTPSKARAWFQSNLLIAHRQSSFVLTTCLVCLLPPSDLSPTPFDVLASIAYFAMLLLHPCPRRRPSTPPPLSHCRAPARVHLAFALTVSPLAQCPYRAAWPQAQRYTPALAST